jgi:hypothetical protein
MAEPRGRLNRQEYAAGVAARVAGQPREAPDRSRASLEASWLAGWDSVSKQEPKAPAPIVPTVRPNASIYWDPKEPMPQRWLVRAPMPCKFCRCVYLADLSQAVIVSQVWGGVAGFLSRCCNKRWKLPADREEVPGVPATELTT